MLALRLHDRNPETERDPSAIEASVALIIGSDPDTVLIIRRAERVGDPWSGHMGLPGGRRSQKDEHLLATAIRETEEEVGLTLTPGNLLGNLLCAVVGLLDGPGAIAGLLNILDRINDILG